jgi:NDP-sugar pyrophosphorylase family protein
VLLAGTRAGKQSEIRNSLIGKGGIIGRNSRVEGAVLGDKSQLTDYSII